MSTFRPLSWPSKRQERPHPKRRKHKKKPKKRHYRYCRLKTSCNWGAKLLKKEKKGVWLVLCLEVDACMAQTTKPQKLIIEEVVGGMQNR